MKLRIPPPAALAVSFALLQTSCMVAEPSGDGERPAAGHPEESAGWNAGLRAVWRAGFDSGLRDSVEGFRFNDDRGAQRLAGRERDIFRRGYRSGYYSRSRRDSRGGSADGESWNGAQ